MEEMREAYEIIGSYTLFWQLFASLLYPSFQWYSSSRIGSMAHTGLFDGSIYYKPDYHCVT